MERLRLGSVVVFAVLLPSVCAAGQTPTIARAGDEPKPAPTAATAGSQAEPPAPPIPSDAPKMCRQTRLEIIRDFEMQILYARTTFPMGMKGLKLKDGVISPSGPELQTAITLYGPAIRPGDPANISFVQIKEDHIHFDINGGPVHRRKWYQKVQISGTGGTPVPLSNDQSIPNPHGTYLDVYFDKYVPEMTARQLRSLLVPVLDFNARNKEEAYLDTVPPKVKQAIQEHRVLVGMNTEMVLHAKGKPPRKVRERDGDIDYEEWIYGQPPQDVEFVRIVGDEVVRLETMRVGGQKIVRTEKEVIIEQPEKDAEAKKEDRPANAPSLRRPGEDSENAPKPADTASPVQPTPPVNMPQPPGDPGPGEIVASRH